MSSEEKQDWEEGLVDCDQSELDSILYSESKDEAIRFEEDKIAWELAKAVSDGVHIPANYSSRIRAVVFALDKYSDQQKVASLCFHFSYPLLIEVSDSLRATFYAAAGELYPDEFSDAEPQQIYELVRLFTPQECISILILRYLSGRIAKEADSQEEWFLLTEKMLLHLEIGALVGNAIPGVGTGFGLLIAGTRCLAMGLLLKKDEQKYTGYRRNLDKSGSFCDLDRENELFGFDHLKVAAHLIQRCGFGGRFGLRLAPHPKASSDDEAEKKLQEAWAVCRDVTELVHIGKFPEAESHLATLIGSDSAGRVVQLTKELIREGSSFTFIRKGKGDLPERYTRESEKARAERKARLKAL